MAEMHNLKTAPGDPYRLGVRVVKGGVNFAAAIPDDQPAELVLRTSDDAEEMILSLPQEDRTGEVASVQISNVNPKTLSYYYRIGGEKVLDPYATKIKNGWCGCVSEHFNWSDDVCPDLPLTDMVIYKVHVKGFTAKARSASKKKGTFAALSARIPYLTRMGFNTVELMPIYEFNDALKRIPPFAKAHPQGASPEDVESPRNYWGYADVNYYFAPRQKYSFSEDSASEVKNMVKAFHKNGMEVLMEMYFPEKTNPMTALRAVIFWKQHYHMDGFRFIGAGVPMASLVSEPLLKKTKMLFDNIDVDWAVGHKIPNQKNLIESNDRFMGTGRRFLKGDEGQVGAFVENFRRNPDEIGVVNTMANTNGFTLMDSVSYTWKHNEENGENNADGPDFNYTWNCGAEGKTRKKPVINLRNRQIRNALCYLFLAQGIPMLQAGDENGNTQNGNNNAYWCDNPIGWVDWSQSRQDQDLQEFVRKLIGFRKSHPILHLKRHLRGVDYRGCGFPDISMHDSKAWVYHPDVASRTVSVLLCGLYTQNEGRPADDFVYIGFNGYWEEHEFALPDLPADYEWHQAIDTGRDTGDEFIPMDPDLGIVDDRYVKAAPRSVIVLLGRRNPDPAKVAKHKKRAAAKRAKAAEEAMRKVREAAKRREEALKKAAEARRAAILAAEAEQNEDEPEEEDKGAVIEASLKAETEAVSAEEKASKAVAEAAEVPISDEEKAVLSRGEDDRAAEKAETEEHAENETEASAHEEVAASAEEVDSRAGTESSEETQAVDRETEESGGLPAGQDLSVYIDAVLGDGSDSDE